MTNTRHALIRALEARSSVVVALNATASVNDAPLVGKVLNLANTPRDLGRAARGIDALVSKAGLPAADAQTALRNLMDERHFYGQYCELAAYEWLAQHNVRFDAQVKLGGADVLNPNGCVIDGHLSVVDAFFDIKAMGFQSYVADIFRERLAAKSPGMVVAIDGSMDVAVKDIETYALQAIPTLMPTLSNGGVGHIPELNWTVRTSLKPRVSMSIQTIDPYRLAERTDTTHSKRRASSLATSHSC